MPETTRTLRPWRLVPLGAALAALALPCDGQTGSRLGARSVAGAETGTIEAGPFRLRYRIEGSGRPTIVIGSAVYYPRIFAAELRRHLRLVFLDHRGFAPSPGRVDRSAYALDALLDDVERARQQLGLERVAVMGHSGQPLLALEYAKRYPAGDAEDLSRRTRRSGPAPRGQLRRSRGNEHFRG